MSRRRTHLLVVLLVVALAAAATSNARLERARSAAAAAREDLTECRARLDDLRRWRGTAARAAPDASQVNRQLREAAAAAGAAERLVGIEPGQPTRVAGDYTQLPVFLRLESLSLRELTTFLHRLSETDPSARAQGVELTPAGTGAEGVELWHADVTVAYVNYHPEGRP